MPRQPRQSWNDLSLFQKIEFMEGASFYPSLSIICLFRRNVGYRLLNPGYLCAIAFVMFILGELTTGTPNAELLQLHAGLILLTGLVQRARGKKELEAGLSHHTWYLGDSGFDFHWLPQFMKRDRRMARFFEPLFAFGTGILITTFSPALGMWLMFAGMSLRVCENAVQRKEKEREMDLHDALIESEYQAGLVEQIAKRHASARTYQTDSADIIHAKLSDDVEALIAKRKQPPRP